MKVETVLYVCVHNAGRSQMAEAFTNHLATIRGLPIRALSAGTLAEDRINHIAEQAMAEVGISMACQKPKQVTEEMVAKADRIIGMGCGVDSTACPARFLLTEDWGLDDPVGQPIERVRELRDMVRAKVEDLLDRFEAAQREAARWRKE